MKITKLQLANYRNLCRQTVEPAAGLNLFVGDNAQGKTNLVESVYLCSIGKSPRTDKDKDLILWGQSKAHVKVNYLCRFGEGTIEIDLQAGSKKKIAVNGVPIAKTGDLMGYFNCIYFSPNEIRIISQSPSERRRFMDVDLCQTDKNYFYSLVRYNKALAQRNNALKQAKDIEQAKDAVFCWDAILAEEGARIVAKRRRFCNRLAPLAQRAQEKLNSQEKLEMQYVSDIDGQTAQQAAKQFAQLLENNLQRDFLLRHTSVGCQRDDIALKINGVDVRSFASQGQLRTTALALKLAELAMFHETTGEFPVLILDDVLSELDADRQKRLLNFHPDLQILLTSATEVQQSLLPKNHRCFRIEKGVCTPERG